MSGPKHTPTYPDWVTKMVGDHYDRIGEGVEDKPHLSIADMILDGYQRGQRDTAELVEAARRYLDAYDAKQRWYDAIHDPDESRVDIKASERLLREYAQALDALRAALREAGASIPPTVES